MDLIEDILSLIDETMASTSDPDAQVVLNKTASRLRDPTLRVAIAGRLKAGKSTLLNALVGESVAPTDAAECTKVVTEYSNGAAYRVWLDSFDNGDPRQIPFERVNGKATMELGDTPLAEIARLRVEFPSDRLERLQLIDTPGTTSISEGVSERTEDFLLRANETDGVDVVLYLLRHVHEEDVDFLEAFGANDRPANPAMAIGVLSRPDEIGGGRSDSLDLAARVCERFMQDQRLRSRLQTIVPISGLLGLASAALTQRDFDLLKDLATADIALVERALLSADYFLAEDSPLALPQPDRERLLDRLGMFGLRQSISLVRHGAVASAGELARSLDEMSGISTLQHLVHGNFASRQRALKAEFALMALENTCSLLDAKASRRVRSELERIALNAQEIVELRALNSLRIAPPSDLSDRDLRAANRILGDEGQTLANRMGVESTTDTERFLIELSTEIDHWNAVQNNRRASRDLQAIAEAVCTTLAQMYVAAGG